MVTYKLLKLCTVFVQIVHKTRLNIPRSKYWTGDPAIHIKTACNYMGAQAQPIYTWSLMEKMADSVTMEYRRSILWLAASSKCQETADRGQR